MKKIVAVALAVMMICSAFACGAGSGRTVRAAEMEVSVSDIVDITEDEVKDIEQVPDDAENEDAAPEEAEDVEEAEAAQEAAPEEAAQAEVSESDALPAVSVCDIAVSEPEILKEDDYIEVGTADELYAAVRTGGKIRLTADISKSIKLGKNSTVDLNGHTLTGTDGTVITIDDGLTVTVTDSAGGGKITGGSGSNGGGIYVMGSSNVTIENVTICNNTTSSQGGGVRAGSSNLTFKNCTICHNTAIYGSAISTSSAVVTMINCTVSDNKATQKGAIYFYNSSSSVTLTMKGCTVKNNTAQEGAGFYNVWGKAEFDGCTFEGNRATQNGGAMYLYADTATVRNTTINGNTAGTYGGGMALSSNNSEVRFIDSTATGNSAAYGGAVALTNSTGKFIMDSGTVKGNSATIYGGGVLLNADRTTFVMNGGKIYGNEANNGGADVYSTGGSIEIAESDIEWYYDGCKRGQKTDRYAPETSESYTELTVSKVYAGLKAVYVNKYTISFDIGFDGADEIEPQTVEEEKLAGEPTEPMREGYEFLGWYNGDEAFDFTTPITEDVSLTAMWKETAAPEDNNEPEDNTPEDNAPPAKEDKDEGDSGESGDKAPHTGEDDAAATPKTGDESRTELMAALMALSGLTLTGMAVTSVVKKRKHSAE